MSEGIGYALGAMLLYGVADYVYKRGASAGAPPHQFLMVQTWFFSSLALLYGLVSGTLAFNAGALWGAAAGVLVVVGYYNFAWSLKSGAGRANGIRRDRAPRVLFPPGAFHGAQVRGPRRCTRRAGEPRARVTRVRTSRPRAAARFPRSRRCGAVCIHAGSSSRSRRGGASLPRRARPLADRPWPSRSRRR